MASELNVHFDWTRPVVMSFAALNSFLARKLGGTGFAHLNAVPVDVAI